MNGIILPEIVAIGFYNAQLAVKDAQVTKNRRTTMFEIDLPTEDGGTSYIDDESAPITKNTVIFAKPGQTRHTRLPFKCLYVHMMVSEGELYDRLMKIPSYVEVRDRERYERIFTGLSDLYNTTLYQDILLMQSLILELLHLLCGFAEASSIARERRHEKTVETVIEYIKDNLWQDLSLGALAERASFSPIHFHNCFKRATGKTLRAFVEEKRIQRAIDLLLTTDLTLSEIAYDCGFSSQSYFSYAFKKRMNVSPRVFVRQMQKRYEGN